MKRPSLIKLSITCLIMILLSVPFTDLNAAGAKQMYYEIRAYHVKYSTQAERVDSYLRDAYLPALHKAGITSVGVFKPVASDTAFGKVIIVFIPYSNLKQYEKVTALVENNRDYQNSGKMFIDASFNDPPFTRYESYFLKAFEGMPAFAPPVYTNPEGERVYELRNYESATEAKAAKKIEMFNNGEIALFKSLGFNAVFYGKVLMGSRMPDLIYMITFQDMATHDTRWQDFGNSGEWKKMSELKEYENTVSRITRYLLSPTSYSDF
ncbi:MAG: NIPSNAP family protein [Bacteroidota bacterium]